MQRVGLPAVIAGTQVWTDTTQKAIDAMGDAQDQANRLSTSITELGRAHYSDSQILQLLGSELDKAASDAKRFGFELDPQTQQLVKMQQATKATEEEAKRWRDVWSHAMGQIVADFAKGVSDIIWHGGSLVQKLKGIG